MILKKAEFRAVPKKSELQPTLSECLCNFHIVVVLQQCNTMLYGAIVDAEKQKRQPGSQKTPNYISNALCTVRTSNNGWSRHSLMLVIHSNAWTWSNLSTHTSSQESDC